MILNPLCMCICVDVYCLMLSYQLSIVSSVAFYTALYSECIIGLWNSLPHDVVVYNKLLNVDKCVLYIRLYLGMFLGIAK